MLDGRLHIGTFQRHTELFLLVSLLGWHSVYKHAGSQISQSGFGFDGPAMLIILNSNRCSSCHVDAMDDEWCIILVFGGFIGSDLFLPALGLAFNMPGGSIVIIQSQHLEHFNSRWTGVRFSVILTCRKRVVDHYQTPDLNNP